MDSEEIEAVQILNTGEMVLVLLSGGKPQYQFVYREARGVYWDDNRKGFKAPAPREWSYVDWFQHIANVVEEALGISLLVTRDTRWVNISTTLKNQLSNGQNT